MSDERTLRTTLVAAVLDRLRTLQTIPQLQQATVVDAGTRPVVLFDSTNVEAQVRCAGDAPGPAERVLVASVFGQSWVIGRLGGSQRLLGYATDTTSTDTFTTQETLGALSVEFEVFQPGRVIIFEGTALIEVDTNNAVVVGEFTYDGTDTGRWMRHRFPLAGTTGAELASGHAYVVDPDVGIHTVTMAGTCTGGTGTLLGGTSPAYLTVTDGGCVGGTMT